MNYTFQEIKSNVYTRTVILTAAIYLFSWLLFSIISGGKFSIANQFQSWIISIFNLDFSNIENYIVFPITIVIAVLFSYIIVTYEPIEGLLPTEVSAKVEEKQYDYSKRPTGITALAVLYAFGVFFGLLGLIEGLPVMVVGIALSGLSGQLVYVITILIGVYLIYGFIKLLKTAWIIAVGFGLYGLLNGLINIGFSSSYLNYLPGNIIIGMILGIFLNIIILVYIIGKADYFRN